MTKLLLKKPEPFLFRFAQPRSVDAEMPGHYCDEQKVWVLETVTGERPIIEIDGGSLIATQSKTMTQVETDDDDYDNAAMVETSTYTKVRQEADDQDAQSGLLELQTKTEVVQERDDEVDPVI